MMTSNDNKATLTQFMQRIWNNGDFTHLNKLVADQYTVRHDPGDAWEGQTLDHATFQERVMYSRNAFPDLRFDIQQMVAEADQVVSAWEMSGTHVGDLPQLPETGRPFAISGMTIYSFADGKVAGHWQAYDRLGFLMQIGFMGR